MYVAPIGRHGTLAPQGSLEYSQRMQEIHICFMRESAQTLYAGTPAYATEHSAGMDLRACLDEEQYCLFPGERVLVPSGIAVQPLTVEGQQMAGFVYSRSGLGAKHGIVVAQGVGVIDSDYRGEIMIMLLNTSHMPYTLTCGERVAQLVFQPIVQPRISVQQSLPPSSRGSGGFGHSGRM